MQLEDEAECATNLAFDQWFARELTPASTRRFQEHVRGCTRCRLRGELLERERAAFLANAPTLQANAERIQQLRSISAARGQLGWGGRHALTIVASAAVILLGLAPALRWFDQDGARGAERRKGGFHVGFYVKRGSKVRRGASGDEVYPGDQLRFTYSMDAPAYLALLGRDARSASVYFPVAGDAAKVAAGSDAPLDFSLELDAQLGDELLFAVACPNAFALAPLQAQLQASRELALSPGCHVERIALHKQAAR